MLIFKDKATFSSLSEIHQPLQQGLETEYQQVAAIAIKLEFPIHYKLSALKSHLWALPSLKNILFLPSKWHISIRKGHSRSEN